MSAAPVTPGRPVRNNRRSVTWAAAGAVLAARLGVGAYLLLRDDDNDDVPDKYVTMPVCAEAVPKLPLQDERRKDKDVYLEQADYAKTECSWFGKDQHQQDGWNYSPSASVSWELNRSGSGKNGTGAMRERFTDGAEDERRANGLGFGDEAYWTASGNDRKSCQLNVRDGNLVIRVYLDSTKYSACEAEAEDIAKAALTAMPPNVPNTPAR
ncbi:hypothetical protein IPZ58_36050 [Streptomyces roseoverticillatus]|uniref:hypothetical protein n=1 Tax=Streptomyces roseoverticillatus TaxID=66429 RepID=UPI001F2761EC|nr:hypothetical protein [Streptomyces roseoverticillatus]MCF3106937.1 hypothetical protein [Streptomyces roseoverticillatus]